MNWIRYAVKLDASILERIKQDPDFENIRNSEAFKEYEASLNQE